MIAETLSSLFQNALAWLYKALFSEKGFVKSAIEPVIQPYSFKSFIHYEFLEIKM